MLPKCRVRGSVWTADLRRYGGSSYHALGLPASASQIEVGAALQRAVDGLVVAAKVLSPELPGIEAPGLTMGRRSDGTPGLVDFYLDARKLEGYDSDGGEEHVVSCCRRVAKAIGHLSVEELAGDTGSAALERWKAKMWQAGLAHATVRNLLHQAIAVLRWGRTGQRRLTGILPDCPRYIRQGKVLRQIVYDTLPEADFRTFRTRCFEQGMRQLEGCYTVDGAVDFIARRQLALSFSFYTGAHFDDADGLRGCYLSVDVGRYERHNTKSQKCVGPSPFDMPEQLQLDCEAELRRRDLPRFPPDELVTRGRWGTWHHATRTFAAVVSRLWPDGSRCVPTFPVLRRSTVWEYTVRGWRTHEIAEILGHVDERMIQNVYRRCSMLGLISASRVPWTLRSGPRGEPTRTGDVVRFARKG
jgi:hypothetical protein